eukprot:scaffold4971_cov254-Pinguiococcus_pyrenoidosus.AAC.3
MHCQELLEGPVQVWAEARRLEALGAPGVRSSAYRSIRPSRGRPAQPRALAERAWHPEKSIPSRNASSSGDSSIAKAGCMISKPQWTFRRKALHREARVSCRRRNHKPARPWERYVLGTLEAGDVKEAPAQVSACHSSAPDRAAYVGDEAMPQIGISTEDPPGGAIEIGWAVSLGSFSSARKRAR